MIWKIILIIFVAGAIGGVINALLTDNGFILPKSEDADGNLLKIRPGRFEEDIGRGQIKGADQSCTGKK